MSLTAIANRILWQDEKDEDAEENDEVDEIEAKTGGEQFVSNPHRKAHFKKKMNKAEIKAAYREHGFAILPNGESI